MQFLRLHAPAKINLVLRVLGKRKDGYHNLCTLFHRISLRDTLKLEKRRDGIRLLCSHPRVPKEKNLIVRAFRLLRDAASFKGGVTVRLTKRIPVGAGLGGGSSNAAAFLLGMNRLYRLGLTRKKLIELGKRLGADVPFFLFDVRHALGGGRGDEIKPLPFRRRLWFLLIPSGKGLSTQKVYEGLGRLKNRASLTRVSHGVRLASAFLEQGKFERAPPLLVNDLQESAERLRPSLRKTRESLSGLHRGSCQMSGSGPTLFLIFSGRREALRARHPLRRSGFSQPMILCHSF